MPKEHSCLKETRFETIQEMVYAFRTQRNPSVTKRRVPDAQQQLRAQQLLLATIDGGASQVVKDAAEMAEAGTADKQETWSASSALIKEDMLTSALRNRKPVKTNFSIARMDSWGEQYKRIAAGSPVQLASGAGGFLAGQRRAALGDTGMSAASGASSSASMSALLSMGHSSDAGSNSGSISLAAKLAQARASILDERFAQSELLGQHAEDSKESTQRVRQGRAAGGSGNARNGKHVKPAGIEGPSGSPRLRHSRKGPRGSRRKSKKKSAGRLPRGGTLSSRLAALARGGDDHSLHHFSSSTSSLAVMQGRLSRKDQRNPIHQHRRLSSHRVGNGVPRAPIPRSTHRFLSPLQDHVRGSVTDAVQVAVSAGEEEDE